MDTDYFESDSDEEDDRLGVDMNFGDSLHNIDILKFKEYVGPRHHLDDLSSVLDYFYLLVEPQFYATIVSETNRYARMRQAEIGIQDPFWFSTSVPEMKAFIAINILMGVHQLPQIESYWSADDRLGVAGIAKIMPKRRFKKICQYLHHSNNADMPARDSSNYDPLHKVRPMIEMLSRTYKHRYKPHCELSVDEAMIAFKGRHFIKQYMPAKPTKWGLRCGH